MFVQMVTFWIRDKFYWRPLSNFSLWIFLLKAELKWNFTLDMCKFIFKHVFFLQAGIFACSLSAQSASIFFSWSQAPQCTYSKMVYHICIIIWYFLTDQYCRLNDVSLASHIWFITRWAETGATAAALSSHLWLEHKHNGLFHKQHRPERMLRQLTPFIWWAWAFFKWKGTPVKWTEPQSPTKTKNTS